MFDQTRPPLSTRQYELLEHLLAGHSNEAAAELLGVTMETVRSHAAIIFAKAGVRNRIELLSAWVRHERERLQGVLQAIPLPLLLADAAWTITWANGRCEEATGYGVSELTGLSLPTLAAAPIGAGRTETTIRRRDGILIPCDVDASVVDVPPSRHLVTLFTRPAAARVPIASFTGSERLAIRRITRP